MPTLRQRRLLLDQQSQWSSLGAQADAGSAYVARNGSWTLFIQLTVVLVVVAVAFALPLGLGFVSSLRLPSVVTEIIADA